MAIVNVIVPIFNAEDWLNKCINSILKQTYTDFELILVNDGSTDKSLEICNNYAKRDSRITVLNQENQGCSVACNTGIEYSFKNNSEYLIFIDADDWVLPNYIEVLYNLITKYKTNVALCRFSWNKEYYFKGKEELYTPEDLYLKFNVDSIVRWNKIYKKEVFKEIKYPPGKIYEDEFTTWKILFKEKLIPMIQEYLYIHILNFRGISQTIGTTNDIEALEEQCNFFKNNNYEKAYDFCRKRFNYLKISKN